jgi:NAD(P)H dehydrogenase (quinone)
VNFAPASAIRGEAPCETSLWPLFAIAMPESPGPLLQPWRLGGAPRADRSRAASAKWMASQARLRTVPPVAPTTTDRQHRRNPRTARPTSEKRPGGMRGADPRQPDPLRQHGRADEAFHRHTRRGMGQRHAGRQARSGVHLDREHARRPGIDAAVDAGAAAAPRLRGLPASRSPNLLLNTTRSGGTPYGASHVAGGQGRSGTERTTKPRLARALGRRVADLARRLQA